MKEHGEVKADGIERRDHFRVMDVLPVIIRKLEAPVEPMRSKVLRGFVIENEILPEFDVPESGGPIPRDIWSDMRRILGRMETKINQILEKLQIPMEDTACTQEQPVCLSATGIRLKVPDPLAMEDLVEIKLRITLQNRIWLLLYGQVSRMVTLADGTIETAIAFFDLDEEIHEILIRYTLQKQREMIRRERGYND